MPDRSQLVPSRNRKSPPPMAKACPRLQLWETPEGLRRSISGRWRSTRERSRLRNGGRPGVGDESLRVRGPDLLLLLPALPGGFSPRCAPVHFRAACATACADGAGTDRVARSAWSSTGRPATATRGRGCRRAATRGWGYGRVATEGRGAGRAACGTPARGNGSVYLPHAPRSPPGEARRVPEMRHGAGASDAGRGACSGPVHLPDAPASHQQSPRELPNLRHGP